MGATISEVHCYKDVGYNTYTKLFNSCVVPVLDYCSGVWGFKQLNKMDNVQNRAIRYFLGVHRFTPLLAINGEMGWTLCLHRRWANMCRLWNRLVNMDDNRLTKQVFDIDYRTSGKTWCSEIKSLLEQANVTHSCVNKHIVDLKFVENAFANMNQAEWSDKMQTVSKLRTYRTFKTRYETEHYLQVNIMKTERSHLAQFRCAVLPLKIETGRFSGLSVEDRICQVCNENAMEDELHFLFHCQIYNDIRIPFINKIENRESGFNAMPDLEKLKLVLRYEERECAKFIVSAMIRRKSLLHR